MIMKHDSLANLIKLESDVICKLVYFEFSEFYILLLMNTNNLYNVVILLKRERIELGYKQLFIYSVE